MNKQPQNEVHSASKPENQVVPNYDAFEAMREVRVSSLQSVLEFFKLRGLWEIVIMMAMVEFYLVIKDIITKSSSTISPFGCVCILVCLFMIFALATMIYLTSKAKDRSNVKASWGREETIKP